MRNLLGRLRRPISRSQLTKSLTLISDGDGSTLSLDFTAMSSLDSRFTFSRSSTATVINSSGLVQYADSNLFLNSAWTDANNNPSQWTLGAGTGTITRSSESRTLSCSSQQYWWYQQPTVSVGLTYTASVDITSVSGTVYLGDIFVIGSGTNLSWYINGVLQASGNLTLATTGRISVVFTNGAVNPIIRMGLGTAGVNVTGSLTLRYPRLQPGSVPAAPYVENTSTSGSYQAPRFDYDPTTLAPRGLLIEGSATNLATYSEDFSNAAWTKSSTNGSMTLTGTAPDNNATSRLLEENTTSYAKHSLERSISISAGIHTLSVWLKEPTSNSRRYAHIQLADGQATAARYTIVVDVQTGQIVANGANNGTAGAPTGTGHSITPYPGGWYRVTISMNHVASPSYPTIMLGDSASLFGGSNQPFYSATTPYKSLIVWGAQLEAGSGASSYIPTGSSTVQRAAESCSMTGTNFSSWYNTSEGTVLAKWRQFNVDANEFATAVRFTVAPGTTNTLWIGKQNTAGFGRRIEFEIRDPSGTQRLASAANPVTDPTITAAGAQKFGDTFGISYNGNTTVSSVQTRSPAPDRLFIGSYDATSGQINSTIARLVYWPTRLHDATLQSLTQ